MEWPKQHTRQNFRNTRWCDHKKLKVGMQATLWRKRQHFKCKKNRLLTGRPGRGDARTNYSQPGESQSQCRPVRGQGDPWRGRMPVGSGGIQAGRQVGGEAGQAESGLHEGIDGKIARLRI